MRPIQQLLVPAALLAATAGAQVPAPQTESAAYTRYELLRPGSGKFRIIYEVTATTAGATHYFNPIRLGSVATDERVTDRASGRPLAFDVVAQAQATAGGVAGGGPGQEYIRVTLPRPVPAGGGESRLLIDKTYEDSKSYFVDGQEIVFNRSLGIKRNAVVLPSGFELVACNFPSQVLQQPDGRLMVSFWNPTPGAAPLVLRARPAVVPVSPSSVNAARLDERAHQNREIVYFLQQPESHKFDLYHDYTESRPGVRTYLNVVRTGSTVEHPSALNLDTGEQLTWELRRGDTTAAAKAAGATPQSEVVVFHFAPVRAGESIRLRMFETYADPVRYTLVGDELMWDRSFGRPANAVVLPAGWLLTNSSIPAAVSELADGRIRLDFVNPRPDEIAVLITGRRRQGGAPRAQPR